MQESFFGGEEMSQINVEKRIHKVWEELEQARQNDPNLNIRDIIGKYQYIYSNSNQSISLVELINYFSDGKDLWEIYQVKGKPLFEDTPRFDTKKEAEDAIHKYLENQK